MKKALQRLIFYAFLLPVFISSAAFAQTSPPGRANSSSPEFEVYGITPNKGPAWGGTVVKIYGAKFQPGRTYEVRFGGIPGVNVKRIDNDTLSVKSPRHPLGIKNADTVDVIVTEIKNNSFETVASPDSFIYVRPGTILSLFPATAIFNGMVELHAALTDSLNNPIDSQMVTFTLGGVIAGTAMTDTLGSAKFSTSISGVEPGVHTGYIGASFEENFFYKASTALPADLTVKPLAPSLTINSPVVTYGENVELKAVLTYSGAPMSGKTISFTLNNNPAGTAVTAADGSATLPLSPSPDAGTYNIKAEFTEAGYDAASASGTLTINKAQTNLTVNDADAEGNTAILTAKLISNVTGQGIKDAVVSFTIDGGPAVETATTNENGEASKTVDLGNISPGKHNISAAYEGSTNYSSSQGTGTLTVKKTPTDITVDKATGAFGGKVTLSARLTTSSGTPLSNMTIHFKLNSTDVGDTLTDGNGVAALHGVWIAGIPVGTHENYIEASFSPANGDYGASKGKGPLEITQAATNLSVSNAESDGGTVTLRARLTSNVTGLGIPEETISFLFNGGPEAGTAKTDANGNAELSGVSVPGNLGPGLHAGAIKASFAGSGNYTASSGSGDLTINKTNTVLTVSGAAGSFGGSVSLSALLKSGSSEIEGQTIKFYLNDVLSGQSSTGSDGIAQYTAFLGTIDAGTYPSGVKAVFEGSDAYGATSGTNSLTVNQAPTSLKVTSLEANFGSSVTLSATLTSDVTQAGISGRTVTFAIQGGPEASAATDANGTASASVDLGSLSAGAHEIQASFSPSGGNYKASSGKGTLTVKEFAASLTVTDAKGTYGGTITLEAFLKKSSGEGLEGKTIKFTFNSKTYSVQTNSGGAARVSDVSIAGFDAGMHQGVITAEFFASDGYPYINASGSLTVEQATTAITVANVTAASGGKADLSATLTSGGSPLQGLTVKFTLNGNPAGEAQTNNQGVAAVYDVSLPIELGPGTHTGAIGASFAGNTNYFSSSGSGNLTINQASAVIQVYKASGPYGGKVNLSAKLTNSSGIPLSGRKLHFRLNGMDINDAFTDNGGVASISGVSIAGIDAGIHDNYIEVSYSPADNNYAPVKAYGQLEVTRAQTSLMVSNVQAYFGSTITLTARLTSNVTNLGIEYRTIVFKIDGNDAGSGVTGADGKASVDFYLGSISPGSHTIDAYYSPSGGNYLGSTGKGTLTVKSVSTTLTVNNATGIYGGTVTLQAQLTSAGTALKGKTVKFTFNNVTYETSTNSNGVALVGAVSIAGYSVGEYPGVILAEFAGDGGYGYSAAYGKLIVLAASAQVTVTSVTGTYGGLVDLSAVLTSGGIPLSGRTLSFKLNGSFVGNASTGNDGRAILPDVSLAGINAGYYKDIIVVSFAASGNYGPAAGSGSLTVMQAPTVIAVSKATGTYGGKVSLKATLTTTSGKPISGMTLHFKLNGIDKGSAVTDSYGTAVLADVSIAGIAAGIYYDYIQVGFYPSGGNYLPCTGKGTLEVGLAETCIAINDVTAVYGSKITLSAVLTSQGMPLSGRIIEFLLNNVSVGTAITDQNGVATKTSVDLYGLGAGLYTGYITARFAESNPYKGTSSKADLEIKKASTVVTVQAAIVQYSDQVTLTAVVTSAVQVILNASGGVIEFRYQVENETAKYLATVTSFSIVNGSLNFSYTFACTLAPCTYKIIAAFTPADKKDFDGACSTFPWGPLTVKPEDAFIEYTGARYFSTPSLTNYNTQLNFCAALTDMPDASRGNITKATVEFRETAIDGLFDNGIIRGKDIPVVLLNLSDLTVGTAAGPMFYRNLNGNEINNKGTTFYVYTTAGGCYYKLSDPTLITVAIPGENYISGGGFIIPNSSAGKYRSQTGTKTGFGFSMIYNTTAQSSPGQVNIVIRGENDKIYLIKSGLISSVSAYTIKNMPGKAASFNSKADLKDITDPRNQVILATGLSLSVEVYDDEKNNENDAFAVTLKDNNSALLYSSNWDGSKTFSQTLAAPRGGGIIRVLSSSGPVSVVGKEIMPEEYALYQNFPNPFNPSTNIQFDLPEESSVKIVIYNILGREVATLVDKDLPAGHHQTLWNSQSETGQFSSGMYILHITAKSLSSQRSLVSTKKMMLVK